ncbi:MAG: ABC transporter permease [Clostridia bacterium]|nr:ABC transporter permease [Clostridia bacterium]
MRSCDVWSSLRRDRRAMAGLIFLVAETLAVLLLPVLLGLEANITDRAAGFWAAPGPAHWLGTDDVGRDVFARLLYGGRVSLLVGFASAALSVALGVPLGLVAGYRRGKWEFWIMRLADVLQSFPSIILILCLVTLVGPSVLNIVLVIGVLGWPVIGRLVYGNTLSIREKEYIIAVRALGASTGTILRKNVLPNAVAPVWAAIAQRVGRAILSESSLSFLGVGIRTPEASWGNLIQHATNLTVFTSRPWIWLPPGILIVLTVLALQMVGDRLRDALDPKYMRRPCNG